VTVVTKYRKLKHAAVAILVGLLASAAAGSIYHAVAGEQQSVGQAEVRRDRPGAADKPPERGAVKPGEPSNRVGPAKAPRPLPEAVVDAWRKAGAQVGWMGWNEVPGDEYAMLAFRFGGEGKAGEVPAFRFLAWPKAETLRKLPVPQSGFGFFHRTTHLADADLKDLARFKSLHFLTLTVCPDVTDAGIKALAPLTSLQGLDLKNMNVSEKGLEALAGMKALKILSLEGCRKVRSVAPLARVKSLELLRLGGTQVTDLKPLAELKSLKRLYLSGTKATAFEALSGLTALEELNLGNSKISDAEMKHLAALRSLRILDLNYTKVGDVGVKHLAGMTSLESLNLSDTNVTNASMKVIGRLTSLRTLFLGDIKVIDAGLKELAGLKSLQTLDLTRTLVTDAGLKELAKHQSLRKMELYDVKVTEAGIAELKKALPEIDIGYYPRRP
jgi:hypothetical protein